MSEFLTIGEPMAVLAAQDPDVTLTEATHFEKFLAGAELNVAVGVARLNHDAAYVSAVGSDPFGQFIINAVHKEGINTDYLTTNAAFWTGFYLKQRVTHGDPSTHYFRKNSAAANFDIKQVEKLDLSDVKLAHLSGIFAALSAGDLAAFKKLNQRLNDADIMVTFDPNLRPALWDSTEEMIRVTNELARHGNIVMPGINEGEILMGSREPEAIADFYLNQGVETDTVIVKLGTAGAFVKQRNGGTFMVPGFTVDHVVDTVGAGDGFAVGLITGLLEGKSLEEAINRACAVGALAVQAPGDNDGYPTPAQLETFYQSQKAKEGVRL
ncbi:sugar kinase [Furfurilactobacillus sp. WILCCON 0119]